MMRGLRTTLLLLLMTLLLWTGAACLERGARYACTTHDDCASQLNHRCQGVAVEPAESGDHCPQADAYTPVLDHARCYYPYCTAQRVVECGDGVCPDGQTCVVAKTVDRSDTRLMCLDLPAEELDGARECDAVDWLEAGVCPEIYEVCVLSFARRAVEGTDKEPRICVPHTALAPLQ